MTLQEPRFLLRYRAVLFPSISLRHYCVHDSPLYGSLPFSSFIIGTNADEEIASLLTEARERRKEAEAGPLPTRVPSRLYSPGNVGLSNPIYQVILSASRIFLPALQSQSPKLIFSSPSFGHYLEQISRHLNATRSAEFVSNFLSFAIPFAEI
jgi:hypothetical protein